MPNISQKKPGPGDGTTPEVQEGSEDDEEAAGDEAVPATPNRFPSAAAPQSKKRARDKTISKQKAKEAKEGEKGKKIKVGANEEEGL